MAEKSDDNPNSKSSDYMYASDVKGLKENETGNGLIHSCLKGPNLSD